jgi:hypothetical protein
MNLYTLEAVERFISQKLAPAGYDVRQLPGSLLDSYICVAPAPRSSRNGRKRRSPNRTPKTPNQPTPNPNPETMKAALLLALYTLAAAALRTVAAGLA